MSIDKIDSTLDAANLLIEQGGTLRSIADKLGLTRQTVLNRFNNILSVEDPELYAKVREILSGNKEERSSRGGTARKANIDKRRKTSKGGKRNVH